MRPGIFIGGWLAKRGEGGGGFCCGSGESGRSGCANIADISSRPYTNPMLDAQKAELSARIEAVCRLAQLRLKNTRPDDVHGEAYRVILKNFDGLRQSLTEGRLSGHFATGAGFGASKAMSEWDLKDQEMLNAVYAAENYYRTGT